MAKDHGSSVKNDKHELGGPLQVVAVGLLRPEPSGLHSRDQVRSRHIAGTGQHGAAHNLANVCAADVGSEMSRNGI
jgi:hypothetical protein